MALFLIIQCSFQSTKHALKQRHTASSVYGKGPVLGSLLSVRSKELLRKKQEVQQIETVSAHGWRHLSGKAHGCLLINTSETGASDSDNSRGS